MLPFAANELPAKALTNGGISRLSATKLVSGSRATSFNALDMVLRSAITLRPLVSVPASDGNLLSISVVLPVWTTRSAIWLVCWASVSVAGAAALISSEMTSLLASICRESPESAVSESDNWPVRAFMVPSSRFVRSIS